MPVPQQPLRAAPLPTPGERRAGLLWGFVGVAGFSLTLPATRVAVAALDPVSVGLGRAVVAALLAAIVLPPLATAAAGALIAHERPSGLFWLCALFGSAVVVGFALWQGGGAPHPADLLLVLAVVAAAIGYAEGGRI